MTARGFALFAGTPPDVIRACAREAETVGYASFWVNHPGAIDGVAALALAARETRRCELGIGVIPLHTHGPDRILDDVRTQALPAERLLLGVGSPNPQALARVRAGVAALRVGLGPPARVAVAALGPRMCRLAGEVADAVLFNWLTPEFAREAGAWVRAGAAEAERPAPRLLAYVRLALGEDAPDRLRQEGARYAAIPAYAAHFARMGVAPASTGIAAPDPGAVPRALAAWDGVLDEVIVRALPAGATREEHLLLVRAARPG